MQKYFLSFNMLIILNRSHFCNPEWSHRRKCSWDRFITQIRKQNHNYQHRWKYMALDSVIVYKSRNNFKAKSIDWGADLLNWTESAPTDPQYFACLACQHYICHLTVSLLTPCSLCWINESINNEKYVQVCCHLRSKCKLARVRREGNRLWKYKNKECVSD